MILNTELQSNQHSIIHNVKQLIKFHNFIRVIPRESQPQSKFSKIIILLKLWFLVVDKYSNLHSL